jgi:hypothetical protein
MCGGAPVCTPTGGALTVQARRWYGSQGFVSSERAPSQATCASVSLEIAEGWYNHG